MISKLSTVSIFVHDQDAAKAFYTEKLGFELRTDMPFGEGQRWIAVAPKGENTEIILYKPDDNWSHYEQVVGKSQNITLQVDDMQATIDDLKANGVHIAEEPYETPWGTFATIHDSEGNALLLTAPSE